MDILKYQYIRLQAGMPFPTSRPFVFVSHKNIKYYKSRFKHQYPHSKPGAGR